MVADYDNINMKVGRFFYRLKVFISPNWKLSPKNPKIRTKCHPTYYRNPLIGNYPTYSFFHQSYCRNPLNESFVFWVYRWLIISSPLVDSYSRSDDTWLFFCFCEFWSLRPDFCPTLMENLVVPVASYWENLWSAFFSFFRFEIVIW